MQPPAYRNKRCLYQKHQPPQHGIDTNVVERSFDIIAQDFTQGIIKFQVIQLGMVAQSLLRELSPGNLAVKL
jgi:hypothetical protein